MHTAKQYSNRVFANDFNLSKACLIAEIRECANDLKITTKVVFSLGGVADVIVLINIQVTLILKLVS